MKITQRFINMLLFAHNAGQRIRTTEYLLLFSKEKSLASFTKEDEEKAEKVMQALVRKEVFSYDERERDYVLTEPLVSFVKDIRESPRQEADELVEHALTSTVGQLISEYKT